jgi:predicted enzyme related to lactoylglutathione lyase
VITGISQVVLPVDDQEAAKRFWTAAMGFEVVRDATLADERWIEVRPPGSQTVVVLAKRPAGQPRPDVPDELPHSNVFFTCDDIRRTHAELTARAVVFPAPPTEMPWGWWSMFQDHEGTRYALGQTDEREIA